MSDRVRTLRAFTTVSGRGPMTMERAFRVHGHAGQIPLALPGKRPGNFTVEHLKNIVLGLAGDQPADVAEAVRTLDGLRCSTNTLLNLGGDHSGIPPVPIGMAFGDFIIQEIEAWCRKLESGWIIEVEADPDLEPRQINMTINPPRAAVIRHVIDKNNEPIHDKFHIENFTGPNPDALFGRNTPPCSRQVVITDAVFIVAAKLLIETRAKKAAATPISNSAPARVGEEAGDDNATPKGNEAVRSANQDGPVLCQPTTASASASAPASRSASASPSRTNRLRTVNRSKANPSQTYGQPSFVMGGGHSGDRAWDAGPPTCNP